MSKTFRVIHKKEDKKPITVVLYQPPYENQNILNKTGWKEKDVTITEVHSGYDLDPQRDHSLMDSEINMGDDE
tara:strand:- start:31 stop:249 length:219 start_codon:yes stop_codon:yes gene_type:complete